MDSVETESVNNNISNNLAKALESEVSTSSLLDGSFCRSEKYSDKK